MLQIRELNFVRKLKWNLSHKWKLYLVRGLTYVLVAVVTAAVILAVMGTQVKKLRRMEEATAKLQAVNAETRELLNQVTAVKQDTQTILDEVTQKENEVAKKIEELEIAYDEVQDKENLRWVVPMRFLNVSSYYGSRTHPVSGEQSFHTGIDLAGPQGTPIVATRSGTVTKAEYQDQAGNFVSIDHLDGYSSSYLHMSKYIVEVGQFVIAGQVIGYCGQTGVATGPHLHFEVYHDGRMMNPAKVVDIY